MAHEVRRARFWLLAGVVLVSLFLFPAWQLAMIPWPVLLMMPPLGPSCTIFSDDFATDQLSTAYDTRSGTWSVGSGVLTTGSTGALLIADEAGTTGHGSAQVTGQVDTYGASFRVVGSYVDDDNYCFLEVTVNSGTNASQFRLWKRESGSDTQLGSTVAFTGALNTDYTLKICWTGIIASGYVSTSPGSVSLDGLFSGSGNQAGVGASANSGTVTLDDFAFTKIQKEQSGCTTCGSADCSNCANSISPLRIQVDIAGCGTLSGSYVVEWGGLTCGFTGAPCEIGTTSNLTCVDTLCLVVAMEIGAVSVYIRTVFGVEKAKFSKSYSGSIECMEFDDVDIPFVSSSFHASCSCNGLTPTCNITTL